MVQTLPTWISQSWPVTSLLDPKVVPPIGVMYAFEALGPIAAPAIPDLARRIALTKSPDKGYIALYALTSIGPAAEPTLMNVMSNLDEEGSLWAAIRINGFGTNARSLIPWLVQNLQHTNSTVAVSSALSLGVLKLDPNLVVPALTTSLAAPSYQLRAYSATAVSRFGELARPALPALSKLLNDPDLTVRRAATNAIRAIAR
jgi:HEAT repeat protein